MVWCSYGHKLSVMCLDISYDGNILISGSVDKTIKIWGLDFGDCHRSLLGHEDSVTAVRFQPETHYFFSASKDGVVKYWDADRFQQILNLPGHFSCVWSLDIPMDASFCVSGSQDRSLRVWRRTDDLVFIEEERERAFEAQADSSAVRDASAMDGGVAEGEMERTALAHPFSAVGSVQTVESLKVGPHYATFCCDVVYSTCCCADRVASDYWRQSTWSRPSWRMDLVAQTLCCCAWLL